MTENKPVIFAFYKNGELIGYRQDTFGTIGMKPKIYYYSKSQVATCLQNIESSVRKEMGGGFFHPAVAEAEEKTYELLQEKGAFEVRIVAAPDYHYEREFNVDKAEWTNGFPMYPHAEIKLWLQHPEDHEVIETHQFSLQGKLNLQ